MDELAVASTEPKQLFSSQLLTDHFKNPRNVGVFSNHKNVGTGLVGTPEQGGVVRLQVKLDASGIIEDTRFKAYGCGAVIAAASWVSQELIGKSLEQALSVNAALIAKTLNLTPVKTYCAILTQGAIQAAINDYKQHQE